MTEKSETITENLFRAFYANSDFIEKSAISKEFGFKSKNNTSFKGYPDFFKETDDYLIVVEAKASDQLSAISEVKHYMLQNKATKDIIGIAVSGQTKDTLKVNYFLKPHNSQTCNALTNNDCLLDLNNISKIYWKAKYGESISSQSLTNILKSLNKTFHDNNKVRDTDRSLFFSGLMIALKDNTFRNTYKSINAPSRDEVKSKKNTILESQNLNISILGAITRQLEDKINNLSKEYSWKDKFSFIKNIDYSLLEYKGIIENIEINIFKPFQNNEKHDILGKAYKIFLSRAGKIDNKNIILTPEHIKNLMIKLARLSVSDVVLDTCTGTGGFLIEAMQEMVKQANDNQSKIDKIKEHQLIGFEVDSVLFSLACSNMFLQGDGRTNLLFRSSLLDDNNESIINNKDEDLLAYIRTQKPTKCIINPPYENNNSIKFSLQAVKYLEDNGKLIIIMPTPTLTKNQKGMTEELLKIAKLDFVIKMPYKLFSEQKRTVNTSIFGFTKTPHGINDEVIYYNLDDDGFISIQHKGRVDKHNKWNGIKDSVLESVFNSKEIGGICEKKKIYRDGILNCAGIQTNINKHSLLLKVSDLFNIEKGTLASDDGEDGDFDFITGSDIWKKHSSCTHNTEALVYVVSAAGSLGRSHYVNGKFIASNLCLILTPKYPEKYPLNLQFYNTFFNNKRKIIVSDLAEGTSKLTIGKVFNDYYIDYLPIEKQNQFVTKFIEPYIKQKNELNKAIEKSKTDIKSHLNALF